MARAKALTRRAWALAREEDDEDDEEDDEEEEEEEFESAEDASTEEMSTEEASTEETSTQEDEAAAAAAVGKTRGGARNGGARGGQQSAEARVLEMAIREQDKAMHELRGDLEVLRRVEAAWSLSEEEARRRGLGEGDMAMISAFDGEDAEEVRKVVVRVESVLAALEKDFGQHVRAYQRTMAAMDGILRTRTEVINKLDRATGIFSRYPELAHYVAGKQKRLTDAMHSTQRALLDGFATSLAKVKLTQGQIAQLAASTGRAGGARVGGR